MILIDRPAREDPGACLVVQDHGEDRHDVKQALHHVVWILRGAFRVSLDAPDDGFPSTNLVLVRFDIAVELDALEDAFSVMSETKVGASAEICLLA